MGRGLVLAVLLLWLCGCNRRARERQCDIAMMALGVGYQNVQVPRTQEERAKQLAKITQALEKWNSSKGDVTLTELRPVADLLAGTLAVRKVLLEQATFKPRKAPTLQDAREAAIDKAAQDALGMGLELTTRSAFEANALAYQQRITDIVGVCAR